jgi:hypothetical protein
MEHPNTMQPLSGQPHNSSAEGWGPVGPAAAPHEGAIAVPGPDFDVRAAHYQMAEQQSPVAAPFTEDSKLLLYSLRLRDPEAFASRYGVLNTAERGQYNVFEAQEAMRMRRNRNLSSAVLEAVGVPQPNIWIRDPHYRPDQPLQVQPPRTPVPQQPRRYPQPAHVQPRPHNSMASAPIRPAQQPPRPQPSNHAVRLDGNRRPPTGAAWASNLRPPSRVGTALRSAGSAIKRRFSR